MKLSLLTKPGTYHQLALRNEAGGIEAWLLTDNEVERIRERSLKYPHLVVPIVVEEPQGLWQRFRAWVTGG